MKKWNERSVGGYKAGEDQKGRDDQDGQVVTTSFVEKAKGFSFTPPDSARQKEQCQKLGIDVPVKTCRYKNRGARAKHDEAPNGALPVEGDGNSFFRCMSLVLTGNQCHQLIMQVEGNLL